ncbi:acetyl-CoA C-acetyltransferase [Desulfovermiculus halophilus]|uniref:acetyl-CoA C-acetyltransferase n=1 Tax=Desulfovermiculus halophilus TaxID=339722 RepID=UPI000487EE3E|nr:acetyl-CoA C-acetyltransferase [Desulfovermiculus halophilus]
MKDVVIVSGARTAVGTFLGTLKNVPAAELGAVCIRETLKKAKLKPKGSQAMLDNAPDKLKGAGSIDLESKYMQWDDAHQEIEVDEVIMGNVLQAGQGQNPARQATIYAGMPKEVPAFTVNKVCASGMKAVALGVQAIRSGDAEVIIAGGMENMSMAPYALPKLREGARMFNAEARDLMVHDGLWELYYGYHMGMTAENIADLYNISREEQDKLSLESHNRARAATANGTFKEEIVPVTIPQRKKDPIVFDVDERPMDTTLEKMGKLPPVFKKDGTVTAGNASGINDAGAALLLMSREKAEALGLEPLAVVKSFSPGGIDPAYMGLGVIPATRLALSKSGWNMNDVDLVELNEAFASQALACIRELDMDQTKTNPNGSGISIGHPIGCTGARIALTLAMGMKRHNLAKGLGTLCIGGGMGYAMTLERP